MRAINIGIQRRKFVVEGVAYKALGRQMVTLVGPHLGKNLIDARETLQRSGVQLNSVQETGEPHQPVGGILQRNAPHQAVNFITLGEQQFGKVGTILPRDPGDQGFALAHKVIQCTSWVCEEVEYQGTQGIRGTRGTPRRSTNIEEWRKHSEIFREQEKPLTVTPTCRVPRIPRIPLCS